MQYKKGGEGSGNYGHAGREGEVGVMIELSGLIGGVATGGFGLLFLWAVIRLAERG